MAPLHPKLVHFPIVLLMTAGVLYVLSLFLKGKGLEKLGFFLHAAGLLTSIAAILSGDYAESNIIQTEKIHELVESHETFAMIATWAFGLLGVWAYLRQKSEVAIEKIAFVLLFWGVMGTMAYTAQVGGQLVYEEGAGVAPMQPHLEDIRNREQNSLIE